MARTRKRRKVRTKEEAQRRHAKKRFLQRFGEELTDQKYKEWQQKILRGDCEHIEHQSWRVAVKRIEDDDGRKYYVVYDRHRRTIVTVLTDEMAERNQYNDDELTDCD